MTPDVDDAEFDARYYPFPGVPKLLPNSKKRYLDFNLTIDLNVAAHVHALNNGESRRQR